MGIQVLSVVGGCFFLNLSEVPGSTGTKMKKSKFGNIPVPSMPIWEQDHFPSPPKKNMATPPGTHTHFDRSGERRSSL